MSEKSKLFTGFCDRPAIFKFFAKFLYVNRMAIFLKILKSVMIKITSESNQTGAGVTGIIIK